MAQNSQVPQLDVDCGYDVLALKNWPSDGKICIDGWTVSHAVQAPDEVAYSELSHHLLVFSLPSSDRQVIQFAGQEYDGPWQKNTGFLLPAEMPSAFAWENQDEVIFFDIRPDVLRRVAAQTECLDADKVELMPQLCFQDEQITRFAWSFWHEICTGGWDDRLYCESLLTSFAIHLLRHYCTFPAKLRHESRGLSAPRLRRALETIHASLDQSLRLETVAAELGLNVYYFSRLFRQSMGISPYQYVLQQRIDKAKRLLKNAELSIAEVAMDCGFSSPSHLARHFRRATGMSPKTYRQQLR